MKLVSAALAVLAATAAAPAGAQIAPLDEPAVIATCGGDMLYEQIPGMDQAEVAERLACYTREFAKQIDSQLPVKVDPVTTLERVSAEGSTLSYHYSVDLLRAQVPLGALETIKAGVRARACQSEDMRNTMSIGGAYRYYWKDREGQPIGELLVTSCEEMPAPSAPSVT